MDARTAASRRASADVDLLSSAPDRPGPNLTRSVTHSGKLNRTTALGGPATTLAKTRAVKRYSVVVTDGMALPTSRVAKASAEHGAEQLRAETDRRDPLIHFALQCVSFFVIGAALGGYFLCFLGSQKIQADKEALEGYVYVVFGFPITILSLLTGVFEVMEWCGLSSLVGLKPGQSFICWTFLINSRFADFVSARSKGRYYNIAVFLCIVSVLVWQSLITVLGPIDESWRADCPTVVTNKLQDEVLSVSCNHLERRACINVSAEASMTSKPVYVAAPFECAVQVGVREKLAAQPSGGSSTPFQGLSWIPTAFMSWLVNPNSNGTFAYNGPDTSPVPWYTGRIVMAPGGRRVVHVSVVNGRFPLNQSVAYTSAAISDTTSLAETDANGMLLFSNASLLYRLVVSSGENEASYRLAFRTTKSSAAYSGPFSVINEVNEVKINGLTEAVSHLQTEVKTADHSSSQPSEYEYTLNVSAPRELLNFQVNVTTRFLKNRHRFACEADWLSSEANSSSKTALNRNCVAECERCRTKTASCPTTNFSCPSGVPKCHTDCVDPDSDDLQCLQLPSDGIAPYYERAKTVTLQVWMRAVAEEDEEEKWSIADSNMIQSTTPQLFTDDSGTLSVSVWFDENSAGPGVYKLVAVCQGVASRLADSPALNVVKGPRTFNYCREKVLFLDAFDSFLAGSGTAFMKNTAWLMFAISVPAIYINREEINLASLHSGNKATGERASPATFFAVLLSLLFLAVLIFSLINFVTFEWTNSNDCDGYTIAQKQISALLLFSFLAFGMSAAWAFGVAKKPKSGNVAELDMCCFSLDRAYASVNTEQRSFYLTRSLLTELGLSDMSTVQHPGTGSFFFTLAPLKKSLRSIFLCRCFRKPSIKHHPADDRCTRQERHHEDSRYKAKLILVFSTRFLLTFWLSMLLTLSVHIYFIHAIDRLNIGIDSGFWQLHKFINAAQSNITAIADVAALFDLKSRLGVQWHGIDSQRSIKSINSNHRPGFEQMCFGACSFVSHAIQIDFSAWYLDLSEILNRTSSTDARASADWASSDTLRALSEEADAIGTARSFSSASSESGKPDFAQISEVRRHQEELQLFMDTFVTEKRLTALRSDITWSLRIGAWISLIWILNAWLGSTGLFETYTNNLLDMRKGKILIEQRDVNYASGSQFVGFQIMHFFLGQAILGLGLSLVLFLLTSNLTSHWCLVNLFNFVVVVLGISLAIKISTILLKKYFLLGKSPKRKVAFIRHRQAFEKTDVLLMMFSIVTGLGMAFYRIFVLMQETFSGYIRLDQCVLAGKNRTKDFGYTSYASMLLLEHDHNNPIKIAWLKCVDVAHKTGGCIFDIAEKKIAELKLTLPKPQIDKLFEGVSQDFKEDHHFIGEVLIPIDPQRCLMHADWAADHNRSVLLQRNFRKKVVRTVLNRAMSQGLPVWAHVWSTFDSSFMNTEDKISQQDTCELKGSLKTIKDVKTGATLKLSSLQSCLVGINHGSVCECNGYQGVMPYDCQACDRPYEDHDPAGGVLSRQKGSNNWLPLTFYSHSLKWWLFFYLEKLPTLRSARSKQKRDQTMLYYGPCQIIQRQRWVHATCWVENGFLRYQPSCQTALGRGAEFQKSLSQAPRCASDALFTKPGMEAHLKVKLVPCWTQSKLKRRATVVVAPPKVMWEGNTIEVVWLTLPCMMDGSGVETEIEMIIHDIETDGPQPKLGGHVTLTELDGADLIFSHAGVFLNPCDWHSTPGPVLANFKSTDPVCLRATSLSRVLNCARKEPSESGPATDDYVLRLQLKAKPVKYIFLSFQTDAERQAARDSLHTAWGRLQKGPANHFQVEDLHQAGDFVGGKCGHMMRYSSWDMMHATAAAGLVANVRYTMTAYNVDVVTRYATIKLEPCEVFHTDFEAATPVEMQLPIDPTHSVFGVGRHTV